MCLVRDYPYLGGKGGGTPIDKLYGCATVKSIVFRQFSLGRGIEIRQFWSRVECNLPEKWQVYK